MKLWLVNLQGMHFNSIGAPHGEAYVLAETADEAIGKLQKYVNDNNLGFQKDREIKSIELVADSIKYPDCGMRLLT